MSEGYLKTTEGWKITANHTLRGVSPSMVDWWWDNIDTTERYQLWHPTDHVAFEWLISPAEVNGHVGAVQRIRERLNGSPEVLTLTTRWEDARQAPIQPTYDHVLLATGKGEVELLDATLMHEYTGVEGGTLMRSHFWLPAQAPEEAIKALYEHNKQEMANFPHFLPTLYADVELSTHLDKGYFQLGDMYITKERIQGGSGEEPEQYCLKQADGTYQMTASKLSSLFAVENITIGEWTWHPANTL